MTGLTENIETEFAGLPAREFLKASTQGVFTFIIYEPVHLQIGIVSYLFTFKGDDELTTMAGFAFYHYIPTCCVYNFFGKV